MRAKLAFKYDCAEEPAALGHAPPCPLVLDLDGTLLRTDLLHEATLRYVKQHPLGIFMLAWPLQSLETLTRVVGIWLIVIGVFEVVSAFGILLTSATRSGRPTCWLAIVASKRLPDPCLP